MKIGYIKDMERAVKFRDTSVKSFCKACFTGQYPTGDISKELLDQIEEERDSYKAKQLGVSITC